MLTNKEIINKYVKLCNELCCTTDQIRKTPTNNSLLNEFEIKSLNLKKLNNYLINESTLSPDDKRCIKRATKLTKKYIIDIELLKEEKIADKNDMLISENSKEDFEFIR